MAQAKRGHIFQVGLLRYEDGVEKNIIDATSGTAETFLRNKTKFLVSEQVIMCIILFNTPIPHGSQAFYSTPLYVSSTSA